MKFGIGLPTGMEGLINPVPFFRVEEFVQTAVLAEDLGFDSVWGNDHYAPQEYVREKYATAPNYYEVLTVLAAVATATERVQLGTAVLVLPMRHPAVVAKEVATLDRISGGRLLLGVGIGAYREEYAAARPELVGHNRGTILEEAVELLQRLLREPSVTFTGSYFSVDGLEMYPKPVQDPMPVLIGGHHKRAIDRAVRLGQGWIPGWRPFEELTEWTGVLRESAEQAGRDPQELTVAPQLSCLLDDTDEQAFERYEHSGMVEHRRSLAYTGRDPELARDHNLIGSAETVMEKVQILHDAGIDHLACLTFCVDTADEYREQLHRFAEGVLRPYRAANGIPEPSSSVPSAAGGAR